MDINLSVSFLLQCDRWFAPRRKQFDARLALLHFKTHPLQQVPECSSDLIQLDLHSPSSMQSTQSWVCSQGDFTFSTISNISNTSAPDGFPLILNLLYLAWGIISTQWARGIIWGVFRWKGHASTASIKNDFVFAEFVDSLGAWNITLT